MNIIQALEINAKRHPLKEALLYENRHYNYEQFNQSINRLANGFMQEGIQKGDHAAVMMKNSDYFAITYFALAKIGAVIVPMNFRLLSKELSYIIDNSDSKHIIVDPEFEGEIFQAVNKNSSIKNLISVPQSTNQAFKSYSDILSNNIQNPNVEILGTDYCQIMYTSGTTGYPKGALFDHDRIRYTTTQLIMTLGYHPQERWVHFAPLFHGAQLMICLVPQIYLGGFGVIYREFSPQTILQDISRHRITSMLAVPAMFIAFLQIPKEKDFDFSTMERFLYGAAPMSKDTVRKCIEYFGTNKFHSLCGQTETGPAGIILYPSDHEKHAGMSGKEPFVFVLADVVNPEGNSVEAGEIGELIIKAPSIMNGYYKNPEATAQTIKDGWLYSGDLALRDEEGYILLVDRSKDMIISGGENVYSIEVENTIGMHPDVIDVAIIGIPDEKWGELVTAVVVKKDQSELTESQVIEFTKQHIASYKSPKKVIFEETLPRNPSGKLMKFQLREKYNVKVNS